MRVLIACEFSGIVRSAFAALGHDAWSVDLLPSERDGNHIQGDVLSVLGDSWDLMIAHPPCTYLCNSGAHWLRREAGRWDKMKDAALFFRALLDAPIPHIAIENPVMHRYAKAIICAHHAQTIQSYDFGHPESKRTALWLKNLPLLRATRMLRKTGQWENQTASGQNKLAPSPERWKERSRTYEGIAQAMASQWGNETSDAALRQLELF